MYVSKIAIQVKSRDDRDRIFKPCVKKRYRSRGNVSDIQMQILVHAVRNDRTSQMVRA